MTEPKPIHCRASLTSGERCDYWGTRAELIEHATDIGHEQCTICEWPLSPHEQQTCERCTRRVRDDVDVIEDCYIRLDAIIEQSGYKSIALNALTIACDGAVDGGGPDDDIRYHDPCSAAATLAAEEDDWRDTFRQPRAPYPPLRAPRRSSYVFECAIAYLRVWHVEAARTHAGFSDYASTISGLRSRMEHVVGLADDPLPANADCFDCGGKLQRTYRPPLEPVGAGRRGLEREGLTDEFTCRDCGEVYAPERYFLALRGTRESCRGWVPVRVAAAALRRPEFTVWSWLRRGEISSACSVVRRNILVDWAEVAERAEQSKPRNAA